MGSFRIPEGLRLGVAAAATQIEGGDMNNSWYAWYRKGRIKDGADPSIAAQHYELWREDAELMQSLGIQVYRMSVEWSRIEPQEGHFSEEAIAHYREEICLLKSYGIDVLLTLHHFANPLWFENRGAFLSDGAEEVFLRFVEHVVRALGDLVSDYVTINEPNVYATLGYFYGDWPPGEKSLAKTMRVMRALAGCHCKAYTLIHGVRDEMGFHDTRVGFAHHMRVFVPKNPNNLAHRAGAALSRRFFQGMIVKPFYEGRGSFPLRAPVGVQRGWYCDFHGLNYYTRSAVEGIGDGVRPGVPVSDLGWEIYPEGIALCAQELYGRYELPIYITENGTCDSHDTFRSRYIYEHLEALVKSGLPVERYYHWCFTDNFEWLEGEKARFGIVHTDYRTGARTVKESGEFFAAVIRKGGVDEALYDQYCRQVYRINGEGKRV